ncbi:MAG: hypothetical protein CMC35_04820 [Flavobacteriaceae bacterium]|nr:hypothetical protein [Flavobacteriaceae bacterium]|tara:strand:- start:33781 stop:34275 length:495 start_codon:yes stop_codon:yes gene_type:complete
MKKLILIPSILFISLIAIAFTTDNDTVYPEFISEDFAMTLDSEYIKTMENPTLEQTIENNFIALFDDITRVNAQYSKSNGYYYLVIGTKNNVETLQLLKVNKDDIDKSTYTYINFSNIDVDEDTEYCTSGSTNPFTCPVACDYYPSGCIGQICGVWTGLQCVDE